MITAKLWFPFLTVSLLPDAGERVCLRRGNQLMDAFDHPLVLLLPVQAVFPGFIRKAEFHWANCLSLPLPLLRASTAPSKRLAFSGLRSKNAVSSRDL